MNKEIMTEKTEIPWKTDADGMLLGAHAHDGQIIDLSYSKGLLSFEVERLSGDIVQFEIDGVTELNLALWEGTILSEIFVWKISTSAEHVSVSMLNAWEFLYRERAVDLELEVRRAAKKRAELFLVHVSCSYGGEIAAICNRIAIYEKK